jgi:hypothetical protein
MGQRRDHRPVGVGLRRLYPVYCDLRLLPKKVILSRFQITRPRDSLRNHNFFNHLIGGCSRTRTCDPLIKSKLICSACDVHALKADKTLISGKENGARRSFLGPKGLAQAFQ